MKFRGFHPKWPIFTPHRLNPHRPFFSSLFSKKLQISGASVNGKTNSSEGGPFFIPGATLATLFMLSALHARRLYEDRKMEEARVRGVEVEFSPDIKATFLGLLPLRSISRIWGLATSVVMSPAELSQKRVPQ